MTDNCALQTAYDRIFEGEIDQSHLLKASVPLLPRGILRRILSGPLGILRCLLPNAVTIVASSWLVTDTQVKRAASLYDEGGFHQQMSATKHEVAYCHRLTRMKRSLRAHSSPMPNIMNVHDLQHVDIEL